MRPVKLLSPAGLVVAPLISILRDRQIICPDPVVSKPNCPVPELINGPWRRNKTTIRMASRPIRPETYIKPGVLVQLLLPRAHLLPHTHRQAHLDGGGMFRALLTPGDRTY